MEKHKEIAALYVATLRAIYLIHQQNHWLTKGDNFYGDHLLFQRLYEAAQENADSAAEKFIGVLGEEVLDYEFQAKLLNKVILNFKNLSHEPLALSLKAEKEFLKLSKEVYNRLESVMTLGMDDMIMSIASKSEEAVYLLQQANKPKE